MPMKAKRASLIIHIAGIVLCAVFPFFACAEEEPGQTAIPLIYPVGSALPETNVLTELSSPLPDGWIRFLPTPEPAAESAGIPEPTATPEPTPVPAPTPEPFRPVCRIKTVECYCGKPFSAEELRELIDWEGTLRLSFAQEPDWQRTGLQGAALSVVNEAGQRYVHPFTVQLVKDKEPPVLYGVHKLYSYLDESVIYMDGIYAEDNADTAPVITLNNAKVNTHKAGTYKIEYVATDFSGNTAVKETQIVLMEPEYTVEYVYELADKVLEKITTPDMTTTEKLKAIFNWGRSHVKYGYGFGHSDWRRAAVMGFTKGTGDCFVFYSTTRALLDRIGVEYVSVERLGGKSRHYWVLVNVGTGWYHFDTTVAASHKHKCFMWTDKQCKVKSYFWRYDPTLCPPVATEPFDYEAQVAAERAEMFPLKCIQVSKDPVFKPGLLYYAKAKTG